MEESVYKFIEYMAERMLPCAWIGGKKEHEFTLWVDESGVMEELKGFWLPELFSQITGCEITDYGTKEFFYTDIKWFHMEAKTNLNLFETKLADYLDANDIEH